ncbi:MAG: carboxypeptidase regulatory-like domain-containing protein [Acidobacteriota bacterium]|nr:carboxypeptidase regulatory-like domain-containing protein [Acidobacteriota bacterium]
MIRRSVLSRIGGLVFALAIAAAGVHLEAQGTGTIKGNVDVSGVPHDGDAVIYIVKAPGTFAPQPEEMDQHDMVFRPHVLPVLVGSKVTFLNHDPVPHNVFSPSYEKYDLGTWEPGHIRTYTFKTCQQVPCAYTQLCRLHENMEAFIVVLQNPYFSVSEPSGDYQITNVPPGNYTLAIWYPGKQKAASRSITVKAGTTLTENFALKP